jgi:hypothetical protein
MLNFTKITASLQDEDIWVQMIRRPYPIYLTVIKEFLDKLEPLDEARICGDKAVEMILSAKTRCNKQLQGTYYGFKVSKTFFSQAHFSLGHA